MAPVCAQSRGASPDAATSAASNTASARSRCNAGAPSLCSAAIARSIAASNSGAAAIRRAFAARSGVLTASMSAIVQPSVPISGRSTVQPPGVLLRSTIRRQGPGVCLATVDQPVVVAQLDRPPLAAPLLPGDFLVVAGRAARPARVQLVVQVGDAVGGDPMDRPRRVERGAAGDERPQVLVVAVRPVGQEQNGGEEGWSMERRVGCTTV